MTHRILAAALAAFLLALPACGWDTAPRHTADCPLLGDGPTSIDITWSGPWNDEAATAAIKTWTRSQRSITATVRHEDRPFFGAPLALLSDQPPTVAAVSYAAVPALARAGAIRPVGDCLVAAGVDFDHMLPAAVAKGDVGGRRNGAPANNDTILMLYDRAAFRDAGLDPDRPPATMREVVDAARVLRDHGRPRPVAFDAPHLALLGLDLDSADARNAAQQWVDLVREGLLTEPEDFKGLPPVGSGAAAMQYADAATLWSYASALADGQAPAADIGIAPYPAYRTGIAPVGGSVWVVSAEANDDQVAAGVAFIAWASEVAQQAALHDLADVLPSTPAARNEPTIEASWSQRPLLRDAFDVFASHPSTLRGWETVIGSHAVIIPGLWRAAREESSFDEAWDDIRTRIHDLERAQATDAASLIDCVAAQANEQPSDSRLGCPASD